MSNHSLLAKKPHHGAIAMAWLLALPGFAQGAQDGRGQALFEQWQKSGQAQGFQAYLAREHLDRVAPLYQLLRSASDWQRCGAEPFAVPPQALWPSVKRTLELLEALRDKRVIGPFEVVSAYRSPALNRCAGGAANSAHSRAYAVDLWLEAPAPELCAFWKAEGQAWQMGLSRYPSGRIHIDTAGYRTWGQDYTRATAFCQ
ncbi:D-Ala-D-Ala carboxypeptidase family metallohydrolase [Pseudomonas sp. KNUC1026]|nr:D-Ala-D-Ala carboxypeptidase family metallohydrolase [Pseudomonas sp. KNUC1026]UFH48699.1 D-Ala-D-Ala carboxypeptidase family metallohydrolase [Pseudomonas sp. KNUC1026]